MLSGKRKIKIDKGLYEQLAEAAEAGGYSSTEELIRHVLEREVAKVQEQQDSQQAEQQLRGLGYIE